jgi:hypothetical protein
MTRQTLLAVLVGALGVAAPAAAHRLDEYLQATRVTIDGDRVGLEIDLTAGANVASRIWALIDTDHDGRITDAEAEAYAQQVLRAIRVDVDGRPTPVTLTAREFPGSREMSLGVGTIHLRGTASVSAAAGRHQLTYLNTHLPETSVYLVNALVPSTDHIQIGEPHRDTAQRGLTLEYRVISDAHGISAQISTQISPWISASAGWSLVALAMVAVLWIARRP